MSWRIYQQTIKVDQVLRKQSFEFLELNTFSSPWCYCWKLLFLGKEYNSLFCSILIMYLHFINRLLPWIINIFRILQPILLGQLIQYFEEENTLKTETAYMLGLGIVLCSVSFMITENIYTFESTHIGIQMRIACCSLMFRKVIFDLKKR